jgi:hypothetical protein
MARVWFCSGLLALAVSATATWAGTAPPRDGMGLVLIAESRSVADYDQGYRDGYNNLPNRYKERASRDYAEGYRVGQARRQAAGSSGGSGADDYERGYSAGLNGKDDRERDSDYQAGYRAGKAKHQANEARSDGRDYARGYRDGYNRWRERAAVASKDRTYAAGFRAGQADHSTLVSRIPGGSTAPIAAVPPPARGESLVGRPSATLERDMKSLGFVQLGQMKKGKESYSTWQSRGENRCLRIVTRDGKVQQQTDVDNASCT